MTPFPLVLTDYLGHWGAYVVYFVIGIAFGAVLEMAGFGNSTKLAAQFYFREQTVLKVMFTAIVVAMLLIFLASAVGLLDYNLIWVNPTYLWPGILGGLIMGVGFIIGGFCPGTSMVAAATLKIDGIFFVLGCLFGIFLFGETVSGFNDFWHSSYQGRFEVPEFLGLSTGLTVLIIVLGAIGAFWGAEQLERLFGGGKEKAPRWRIGAAGAGVMAAVALVIIGQPTTEDRWNSIKEEKEAQLERREVQIDPAELLKLLHDDRLTVLMLDVRSESDYNQFHILDAEHVEPAAAVERVEDLLRQPENTVIVVMSNDETAATAVWKTLQAESVPNVYILAGGVNRWIDTFADTQFKVANFRPDTPDDHLRYRFDAALGARYPMADPNPDVFENLTFVEKVQLQAKRAGTGGGCG